MNNKIETFGDIRRKVQDQLKFARESNTPKDPFEVEIPSIDKSNVVQPEGEANKVKDSPNVVKPEGEANKNSDTPIKDIPEVKETDVSTPAPQPSEVKNIEEQEKKVVKIGSNILTKLKDKLSKKATSSIKESNIAANIDISIPALAKIASEILNTEEGVDFASKFFRQKAGEEYANNLMKEASEYAETYKKFESDNKSYTDFLIKCAAAHEAAIQELENDPELQQAYANGAADAENILANPDLIEADIEENPSEADITAEDVINTVVDMVEKDELDEDTASELINGIINESVSADIDNANPSEVAEEPKSVEDNIDASAEVDESETPKDDAGDDSSDINVAKLAAEIIEGTDRFKKAAVAEGIVEDDGETSIDDVISVVDALVQEGSLSEEEAQEVLEEIADAVEEEQNETSEMESDADKPCDSSCKDSDDSEMSDDDIEEEVKKAASIFNK